ncbi:MAG TPA: peptidase S10 [Terracidiphilus sp.]|nr:peptidase S10 [Terracidiphilus sp.]
MSNTQLCRAMLCCAVALVSVASMRVWAGENKPAAADHSGAVTAKLEPGQAASDEDKLLPLPPEKSVQQTMVLNGKTLHYAVTVGAYPTRDKANKTVGQVVVTSYTMASDNRPVTFALNGGPGGSSVYLNFGAIGPKHLQFGNQGDSPSAPAVLTDNQGTWLDFTDLVFIDPIGTGFSRSLVPDDQARSLFYSAEPDIEYLASIMYDWLVKNRRLDSRKYIVGESYGGFRAPRITYYLQSQIGVGINGMVLVSPALNFTIRNDGLIYSPLPWMLTLPSIVAAHLERQSKLTAEAMKPVIAYDEGEYATTLIKGSSDPAATDRMIQRVTEMTGLDPEFVKLSGGRLDAAAYLREVNREQGRLASVYDPNVTMFDPFPFAPERRANDPVLATVIAPVTTAMVNFLVNTVGWKVNARYNALSYDVIRLWKRDDATREGAVTQLRQTAAADPQMRVLIVHGWDDLTCPFMGSVLSVNQMPIMGDPGRISVREYPGGHMFYTREGSRIALHNDVMEMVSRH